MNKILDLPRGTINPTFPDVAVLNTSFNTFKITIALFIGYNAFIWHISYYSFVDHNRGLYGGAILKYSSYLNVQVAQISYFDLSTSVYLDYDIFSEIYVVL